MNFGYDFECNYNNGNVTSMDLTAVAYNAVCEHYNIFSPESGTDIVDESEMVSGKGVMAKLKITLNKPKYINHLSIDFFTEYPMEILSLMYQVEEGDTQPVYELSLSNVVYSNHSLYLHFPHIYAKVFYLILKQETYTLLNHIEDQQLKLREAEWVNASVNSRDIYLQEAESYLSKAVMTLGEEMVSDLKRMPTYLNIEKPQSDTENDDFRATFRQIKRKIDYI